MEYPQCPECNSETWKYGFDWNTNQIFLCKECRTRFTLRSLTPFTKHKFPDKVIIYAVKFYYKYKLSTADVSRLLGDLNIEVSDESVRLWIQEFTPFFRDKFKAKRKYTKTWHIDESFVRVSGQNGYLFTVEDSNNNILAILLSDKRDSKSAKKVLKHAEREAGFKPEIVVSDEYPAYQKAVKKMGRKCKHVKAHFKKKFVLHNGKLYLLSNNRIEGLFSHFKPHYHRFRGFKSFRCGNVIANGFKFFHNLKDMDFLDLFSLKRIPLL